MRVSKMQGGGGELNELERSDLRLNTTFVLLLLLQFPYCVKLHYLNS
jgi:hypothetical protein